jgi:hypothetical protein
MAGVITLKFSVMKDGIKQLDMKSPIYIPGPVEPQFGPGRYIYFEGFSVDEHGKQHYLDTTVAYRQTSLRVIEYLRRFGESLVGWKGVLLLTCFERLQRLPDLSAAVLRPGTGTCSGYCGYTQCVHDDGSAHGYLRFRYQSPSSC